VTDTLANLSFSPNSPINLDMVLHNLNNNKLSHYQVQSSMLMSFVSFIIIAFIITCLLCVYCRYKKCICFAKKQNTHPQIIFNRNVNPKQPLFFNKNNIVQCPDIITPESSQLLFDE
jgi:hypothetical protein